MTKRLNQNGVPFDVDDIGSEYITYLHKKLEVAEYLAKDIEALNPKCLTIGAGRMAALRETANSVLRNTHRKGAS